MTDKNSPSRARQKGFTLVEIMVVIVILGLLMTLVVPNVMGILFDSEEKTARQNVNRIDEAVQQYMIRNRGKVRGVPSLEDLITPDENNQPYLKGFSEVPKDPWGNAYVIQPGDDSRTWEVLSYGKDGAEGTEDDISSKTAKDN